MNDRTDINKTPRQVCKKTIRAVLVGFVMLFSTGVFSAPECAAFLFFHKPAYQGRIIDMETKEPLEGVVVVAVYSIDSIIGGPAGGWDKDIHAQEVLTDKDGFFRIPSYTTLIGLNSKESHTQFIIFKPGYASYPWQLKKIVPFKNCRNENTLYFPPHCRPAAIFSKKTGVTGEIYKDLSMTKKIVIEYGIVELPKVNTWEERNMARSVPGTDFNLPILYQMVELENEWLRNNKGWRRE